MRMTLFLDKRSVFNRSKRGNPPTFRMSLPVKSIVSNWSSVGPMFSITAICCPRRSISLSLRALVNCEASASMSTEMRGMADVDAGPGCQHLRTSAREGAALEQLARPLSNASLV